MSKLLDHQEQVIHKSFSVFMKPSYVSLMDSVSWDLIYDVILD